MPRPPIGDKRRAGRETGSIRRARSIHRRAPGHRSRSARARRRAAARTTSAQPISIAADQSCPQVGQLSAKLRTALGSSLSELRRELRDIAFVRRIERVDARDAARQQGHGGGLLVRQGRDLPQIVHPSAHATRSIDLPVLPAPWTKTERSAPQPVCERNAIRHEFRSPRRRPGTGSAAATRDRTERCATGAARHCARPAPTATSTTEREQQRPRVASGRARRHAPTAPESRLAIVGAVRHPRSSHAGSVKVGSVGSVTSRSRSQPSFSSLRVWIATALALASRSGSAWNSETQQRKTL